MGRGSGLFTDGISMFGLRYRNNDKNRVKDNQPPGPHLNTGTPEQER